MNIDDEAMRSVVAKAILDNITPETKEKLITNAIKSLLEKPSGSGYNAPSTIQDSFNRAVAQVAGTVATDMLKDDAALKEKIKTLMLDAWEKLTAGDKYAGLVQKISYSMEKAITGDRY